MSWAGENTNIIRLAVTVLVGFILWFLPGPEGVSVQGWHLFAIFVSTMIGIILKPYPMGVIVIASLAIATLTQTLSYAEAFSGFCNEIVWLVVFAFFVARGFVATGLGNRMAYKVMSILGKNSIGLGYGLVATDFLLSPTIPSVTARSGGIVYPIVKALADVFTGRSHDPKMGGYLAMTAFQGSAITSALFLTSMAGNPLIAELARSQGIEITWASWAIAAIIPGLISLFAVPYIIYKICPPTIRQTPHAKEMAIDKLKAMGPMKPKEWVMLGTFVLMLVLWIVGPGLGIKATIGAMMGLAILLLTGILKWKDVLEEYGAWDTFIWFASLVTLATFLNKFGMTTWFSDRIVGNVQGMPWVFGFLLIALIYFYSHYFFASNVAHIGAMYAPLLILAIALGTPPELAALMLAFFSNLFGGLTHYGSGPAPIFFGAGYVPVGEWWRAGLIVSAANIAIWVIAGGIWWKIIGLW